MNFNNPTTFAAIPVGGQFIEAFTTCNEIATRIEPMAQRGKLVNAQREKGKLVAMVDWEPVFVHKHEWEYEDIKSFGVVFWKFRRCECGAVEVCNFCDGRLGGVWESALVEDVK